MKTAVWSLAALAGFAFAAPGNETHKHEGGKPHRKTATITTTSYTTYCPPSEQEHTSIHSPEGTEYPRVSGPAGHHSDDVDQVITPTGGSHTMPSGHVSVPSAPAGGASEGAENMDYPTSSIGQGHDEHVATKTLHYENSTITCTTPTPYTDFCVPCKDQPGDDPEKFCGYTVEDNNYDVVPNTCRTVEYDLYITNTTIAPNGVPRQALLVNGQMPGPLIEANWGDTVIVHVHNQMTNNGTSMHWHGIRQHYTNEMDGVNSITQCALAPGQSQTYKWRATNYGSSWYHSHFALQTYMGVFGPMVINGPTSMDYDIDSGHVILQDWSQRTVDEMFERASMVGPRPDFGPRVLDTGLINGMNVWGEDGSVNQTGERFQMDFVPGKSHRLRVLNSAIQSTFKFHIDGHKFWVIANDFVPIVPYETDILTIHIGQRYDIIVNADQPVGDYWMRSDNQQICAQLQWPRDIKGVVHYQGSERATPTSSPKEYVEDCNDEPYESLTPYSPMDVGEQEVEISKLVAAGPSPANPSLFKWTLGGTAFRSEFGEPTLRTISQNGSIPHHSGDLAIEVPQLGQWVYVVIDSAIPLPHPMHLHGHDFHVLAQGAGLYNDSIPLNLVNPPRRDTAIMPHDPANGQGGYLVVAFKSDNPGAWLMHCHIGWHVAMGFAMQIIENLEGIQDTITDSCKLNSMCDNYNKFFDESQLYWHPNDSGV